MIIETVKMSSKGQIVIPQGMREELNAGEGTIFAIARTDDAVVLKKLETPSKEEILKKIEVMAKEGRKHLERIGIKESDIPHIVQRSRGRSLCVSFSIQTSLFLLLSGMEVYRTSLSQ